MRNYLKYEGKILKSDMFPEDGNVFKAKEDELTKNSPMIETYIALIPNQGHIITSKKNYTGGVELEGELSIYAKNHDISGPDALVARGIHNTWGEEFVKPNKKFVQIDVWQYDGRGEKPKFHSITHHGFIEPIAANWNLKHNFYEKIRDESYNKEYPDGDVLKIDLWWPEDFVMDLDEGDSIYFSFLDKNDEKVFLKCTVNHQESRHVGKDKGFKQLTEMCLENACRCAGCHPDMEKVS